MLTTIECAGHPRDMGLAQGTAARLAIRREAERLSLPTRRSRMPSLQPLAAGTIRGVGAAREIFRHYSHLSERIEGLARRSDLPIDTILAMHLRVRAGGAEGGLLSRRATLRARSLDGPDGDKRSLLERTLPASIGDEAGWILRESRPEVGFRSVEVTLPWLVSAVAGVNEGGLAVVGGPLLWGRAGQEGRPSSMFLVQECLQRFADLDGALDWCRKRPVEGEQSIVLGDAFGAVATVVVGGTGLRVQAGEGELHLEGGEVPASDEDEARPEHTHADRVQLNAQARRLRMDLGGVELEVGLD